MRCLPTMQSSPEQRAHGDHPPPSTLHHLLIHTHLPPTLPPQIGDPATNPNGKLIASAFPNPWPVELGRIDSAEPGPNRVPAPDADVATIRVRVVDRGVWAGERG